MGETYTVPGTEHQHSWSIGKATCVCLQMTASGSRYERETDWAHLVSRIPGGAREHGQEQRDYDVPLDNGLEALEDKR